ncbi:MAG: prolyl oligopeptidase family serine peptidase [Anaerolineae bacterium]
MPRYRFEQYSATRIYTTGFTYSPDGTQIAHVTNTTGQFNLWVVPSGGGMARQLTSYADHTVRAVEWAPDGSYLIFQADQNGDEFHQLYKLSVHGGWGEAFTSAPQAQHYINGDSFSPDGKTLAYAANDLNPMNMEIILRDVETGETRRPFPSGGGMWFPFVWAKDGHTLIGAKITSNLNSDIYLFNTETGEAVLTTEHEGSVNFYPVGVAPDGSGFYLITNDDREFIGLAFYTFAEKRWSYIETPDGDIEQVSLSKDGRRLIWSVNENGASKLYGRDLTTGQPITLPALPLGQVDAMTLSPDGTRLALVLASPTEAANLYEFNLDTGVLTALGQSMIGGIDPADMIVPEAISFPTFDGRQIPAWLYRPKGDGPFPVILSIHGGPDAQERPRYLYNGFYQYMLDRGFGILAPNIRGSTGYGKTYQTLIYRDWGGAELKDIEHAAKYLHTLDWVDQNRIAVFGGSFGGFATLSAMTRLPQYWALGVDIVGPSNLLTFVTSVPPHWRSMMEAWVGDAEKDHDLLTERSPITYVNQIKAPLLVIQGAKDPRVVQAESDQMVEKIRANGGDVRYYVDEQEGHGTTRRENAIKWYRMIAEYMQEYLLDEASPN